MTQIGQKVMTQSQIHFKKKSWPCRKFVRKNHDPVANLSEKSWPCRKFVRKIHDPVQKMPDPTPSLYFVLLFWLPARAHDFMAREGERFFRISDLKMWNVLIGVVVWSLTYLVLLKSKRFNNKETVSRVLAVLHSFLASRCVELFVLDFPFHFRKFGQVSGL